MAIYLDPTAAHQVLSANSHYYKEQTEPNYLDRVLDCHDLIYLLSGSWVIAEEGQEYSLKPGDVLLLAAGRHHHTCVSCEAGTRTFCIHISCAPTDAEDAPSALSLPSRLSLPGSHTVQFLFEQIVSAQWSDRSYRQERLSSLFTALVYELAAAANAPSDRQSDLADRAISQLMADPHRRILTSEMAQMLYVSEKKLNDSMRQRTGMPFYAYQKALKLDMVASQLRTEPDLRISEIAEAFDFHDEFHLSNAFKKKFGMSPQNYRNSHI